ncbi:TolC family outer membrane protein [Chitinibacter sp. SCUT-21]|uniref:TolC family outer membrane protein n=1 Tax=Chitinibacter sp. SCUT-21 TaxID=2970891 RepID=UPI0035A6AB73
MKLKAVMVALALLPMPWSAASTLEQAVAQAIDTQPSVLARYARYESVLADRRSVQSEYLPQLSLRGEVGPENTRYSSGRELGKTLTRDDLSIRLTQELFSGFRTQANSERLWHEAESERLGVISSAENLAVQVSASYLDVLKARELLELANRNVADHEKILADIKGLVSKGYSSDSDIAQVSSRLATARSSQSAARNNLADIEAKYTRLVGVAPEQLIEPRLDTGLIPASLNEALTRARELHPELAAAEADIRATDQEIRASRAGFYPQVSLELSANTGHDQDGNEGRDESARALLVLNYDLFNGGRDRAREQSSAWRRNEALNIRQKATREVDEGTELAWNAWHALNEQLTYLQQSVDAATAAEAGYITQFDLGRRTLLDVLNAKVEVFMARRNYVTSKYDRIQAGYRLFNATGQLAYALRVNMPTQFAPREK